MHLIEICSSPLIPFSLCFVCVLVFCLVVQNTLTPAATSSSFNFAQAENSIVVPSPTAAAGAAAFSSSSPATTAAEAAAASVSAISSVVESSLLSQLDSLCKSLPPSLVRA